MNEVMLKIGDIELKSLSLQDVNDLFDLISKNKTQMGKWLLWANSINSTVDVERLVNEYLRRRENNEGLNLGIWLNSKLVGCVSFSSINILQSSASIAYWIDSEFQGRGIISKACSKLIEYGFSEMNLNRIEANCAESNEKSKAIPIRLGFKLDRISNKTELIRGGNKVNNYHYSLSEADWRIFQNKI